MAGIKSSLFGEFRRDNYCTVHSNLGSSSSYDSSGTQYVRVIIRNPPRTCTSSYKNKK